MAELTAGFFALGEALALLGAEMGTGIGAIIVELTAGFAALSGMFDSFRDQLTHIISNQDTSTSELIAFKQANQSSLLTLSSDIKASFAGQKLQLDRLITLVSEISAGESTVNGQLHAIIDQLAGIKTAIVATRTQNITGTGYNTTYANICGRVDEDFAPSNRNGVFLFEPVIAREWSQVQAPGLYLGTSTHCRVVVRIVHGADPNRAVMVNLYNVLHGSQSVQWILRVQT